METTKYWSVSLIQNENGYSYQLDAPDGFDYKIIGMHLAALAKTYGYDATQDGYKAVIELLASMPVTSDHLTTMLEE